jgi:hypothetical protein
MLRLDFCPREAATFACKAWHYSRSMPSGRLVTIGAWEGRAFIGAVVFGRGASSEIASPFNVRQDEICELCRVALGHHVAPSSQIVARAVRLLRRQSPGLRVIVSYADPAHGHFGILYQACGWLFLGTTNAESLIRLNGRIFHPRTVGSRYRTRAIDWLQANVATDAAHFRTPPKFRYVLPLDDAMRQQLAARVRSYPKRPKEQAPASSPAGLARATRSRPLHPRDSARV